MEKQKIIFHEEYKTLSSERNKEGEIIRTKIIKF